MAIKDNEAKFDIEAMVEKIQKDKAIDKEILRNQLELLAEYSKKYQNREDLGNISLAMCEIYKLLYCV